MIPKEDRGLATLVMLQVFLTGIMLAVVHPHITNGSVGCFLLVIAAEFVVIREVRQLGALAARNPNPRARSGRARD